jgi:dolichol-phosphate mannosyltransferase
VIKSNHQLQTRIQKPTTVTSEVTRVSIIIPCFNEEESIANLEQRLNELIEAAADHPYEFEFVFVDDGSSDDTWNCLRKHFGDREDCETTRLPSNLGMMAAVMHGFQRTENEIICSIDSDCTYVPTLVLELLPLMTEKVGMATASPYHPNGQVMNVPAWRIWLSKCASRLYKTVMKNKLTCYTCGFRAYRREAIEKVKLENNGFAGTTELAWRIDQRGWLIREAPATLNVRQFGQSKMRTMQVMIKHLKMLMKIGWNRAISSKTN